MRSILRNLLRPGDTLALCRQPGGAAEEWTITGIVGIGGNTVCYNAKNGMKSGRLKEFCPDEELSLARTGKGQLYVCRKSDQETFASFREYFCGSYRLLEQTKANAPGTSVLNNFIPPYELLWGDPGPGMMGTVYVWTPDDKQGILFSDYLVNVNRTPEAEPEQSLYNILEALLTVADCLRILHGAALLHLDLKPSNFMLLWDGADRIRPGSISLFDIDTLYMPGDPDRKVGGTLGFSAPEALAGKPDHRSDLYSLGATLLNALQPRLFYKREHYSQLDRLAADAPLIRCSEINSNVFLRYTLGRILKKTLAYYPWDRYSSCEELMEDLKKARTILLPAVFGPELGGGRSLAMVSPQPSRSAKAVLQDLLFRYPLEEETVSGEDDLTVLVLGAGTYGQTFLDVCLQTVQDPQRPLRIIAASRDPEMEKEIYLGLRPGLTRFVDCDTGEPPEECYARLRFMDISGNFGEGRDREIITGLMNRVTGPVHRIFVAVGDDERNRDVAKLLAMAARIRKYSCRVHYAVHGSVPDENGVLPVQMDAPLETGAIHPDLMRMAFNAHVSWMNTPNPNMHLAWGQFLKKYNLEASLAYALSIRGKLRSLGIRETDPAAAAAQFREALKDEAQIQRLAAWEHRRWVMEKVTSGWQPPEDTEEAGLRGLARGSYVDKLNKVHPCLVPSRPGMPLAAFAPEQWDTPCPAEEILDPLDKVSLTLHRAALRAGAEARRKLALDRENTDALARLLEGTCAEEAFRHYRLCLKDVLRGSEAAARQLPGLEKALREIISGMAPEAVKDVLPRLQQLHRTVFPVVESCFRRDYKTHDLLLIRRIPHILTFNHQRTVAVVCTEQGSLLEHGASPLALQPKEVALLVLPERQKDWEKRMASLLECLGPQQRVTVTAVMDCEPEERLLDTMNRYQREQRIAGLLIVRTQEQLTQLAVRENWLLAADSLVGECAGACLGRRLETLIPSVRYDRDREVFSGESGAEFWQQKPQLTLNRGWIEETVLPWKVDTLDLRGCWPSLQRKLMNCEILLAKLPLNSRGAIRTWSALFPERCCTQARRLLAVLQGWNLAEEGSRLEPGMLGGLRLNLRTRLPEKNLNNLARSLEMLEDRQSFYGVRAETYLEIRTESDKCTLVSEDARWLTLLEQLQNLELITGLRICRGKITFSFASDVARRLMLRPGGLEQHKLARQLDEAMHHLYLMDDGSCLMIRGFRMGRVYQDENGRLWLEKMTLDWNLRPAAGEIPTPLPDADPGTAAAAIMEEWKKEQHNVPT